MATARNGRMKGKWSAPPAKYYVLGAMIFVSPIILFSLRPRSRLPHLSGPDLMRTNRLEEGTSGESEDVAAIPYTRVFLDDTSMWAMGANARTVPPRRQNVPLVTWSAAAAKIVGDAWTSIQFNTTCERSLILYPTYWGLTSQLRDYGDAAILSLAFNRPLLHVADAKHPKWCSEDAWLGCFFEGFDTQRCSHLQHRDALRRSDWKFTPNTSTPALRRKTVLWLNSSETLVLNYLTDLAFVLDDPIFFPHPLWEALVRDKHVRYVDQHNLPLDPMKLRAQHPDLYLTLALSALRTILMPVAFPPRNHVVRNAYSRRRQAGIRASQAPCVALHVRWTDKVNDGGIAARMTYNLDYVLPALNKVKNKIGRRPSCILLLTDDDRNVLPMLRRALKEEFDKVQVLTPVSEMFDLESYQLYAKLGHGYVSSTLANKSPEKAYAYFMHLVVGIIIAASFSDALIGVGSSGVSQLLSQYMGGARRVDANALAIWQEDLSGVYMWP